MSILRFRHKGLERFFNRGSTAGIQTKHADRLRLILGRLNVSLEPKDMMLTQMHRPPHPGEILRELCLKPLDLTVTDAAKALGVSRKTLSAILNRRAGISPEMAVRLSIAFDTTAESWLRQQIQYDLWLAEQSRKQMRVRKLAAA